MTTAVDVTGLVDCACPWIRHVHGTNQAYTQDECRCVRCRTAHAAYESKRRRLQAYGQWNPWVVNPVGAVRRLQALAVDGWSANMIGAKVGLDPSAFARIRRGVVADRMHRDVFDRIAAVYDELAGAFPIVRTAKERASIARTRSQARKQGWAPWPAWDDDTIDDPAAQPQHKVRGRHLATEHAEDRTAEVARLTTARLSAAQIADRLGVATRTVARDRARTREQAA